jgi:hypothetical protein
VVGEVLNVIEDPFDKLGGSNWILQSDVISDCIQVSQGRF